MLNVIGLIALAARLVPGLHLNIPGNPDASGNTEVDWTYDPTTDPSTFKLLLVCNCAPYPVINGDVQSSFQVLTFSLQGQRDGGYWLRAIDTEGGVLANSDTFSLSADPSGLSLRPLPSTVSILPLNAVPPPIMTADVSISSSGVTRASVSTSTSTLPLTSTTVVNTAPRTSSHTRTIVGAAVGGFIFLALTIFFLFYRRGKLRASIQNRDLTHDSTRAHAPEGFGFIVPFLDSSMIASQPAPPSGSLDDPNMRKSRMIPRWPLEGSLPTTSHENEQNYQPQSDVHGSQPNRNEKILGAEPLAAPGCMTDIGQRLPTDSQHGRVPHFVRHTDIAEGAGILVELPPEYCENRPRLEV